jgi:hypothetical protein
MPVICGGGIVKLMLLLLVTLDEVTVTGPLIAAVGTLTEIWVSDVELIGALTPLNFTVGEVPNPLPLICTVVFTVALEGDIEVMMGFGVVKTTSALLVAPNPLTVTGPVVAVAGTVARICVSPQLVIVAATPFTKRELLLPLKVWTGLKPDPATVIAVPPGDPLLGETPLTCGGVTVKSTSPG